MGSFLVIDREYINKIFIDDDPEIEMIEFKTKEEAIYYVKHGFKKDKNIKVFTDGACSMNGTLNAKAGIGIYFGEDDKRNVSERIDGKQTNNTAELSAVIRVFKILEEEIKSNIVINIYTDSDYVIKCCTSYGEKCFNKGWKNKNKEIPNLELVKKAYTLYKNYDNVK